MNNLLPLALFLIFHLTSFGQQAERQYDYTFFDNSLMPGHFFYSSTDYSKGSYIKNIEGRLPVNEAYFFTPPNSLELTFTNGEGQWEAAVSHARVRGQNFFKPAQYLSFWIYPEDTDPALYPKVALANVQSPGPGEVEGRVRSESLPIDQYLQQPDREGWLFVKIPLQDFRNFTGRLAEIVFLGADKKGSGRLFIDQLELLPDIAVEDTSGPDALSAKGYERHVDLSWPTIDEAKVKYIKIYRSEDNTTFVPIGVQRPYYDRYTDFVGSPDKQYYYKISYLDYQYGESELSEAASAQTRPFSDEELLDMVQEASFRYYWEAAEPNSGLARENIPGRKNMIAAGASGFGIMAIIVGVERKFITRDQAVGRMQKIVSFLEQCDKYHGAVSHFIDGPTRKTTPFFGDRDDGGDLVETSFLFQGLLTARAYFDKNNQDETSIRESITRLWEGVEWSWYDREKEDKFLTWHWSENHGWIIDHKLIGWNETMITYILAMASPTHPIPASMYYNGWANQQEKGQNYRKGWGKTEDGFNYVNGHYYHGIQLDVGVANGGPLFFVHYSYMGLDPHQVTDRYTNYFENNQNIALINWHYCTENPNRNKGFGEDFWGLTASDGPWGYRALEPRKDVENGTLAPTGALASFPYTPQQSMAALKNLYRNHGQYLWGEYGFRDAVNLNENWVANIFMGLNQAPVTVMIENYRTGLIWELFMENKEIAGALKAMKK